MTGPVPFSALLRSEWTKLRTVRSTWWCLAVTVLLVAGLGWLAAATTGTAARPDDAVEAALTGFAVGQVVLVVLGVLVAGAEFGSGMALTSLTAVPRRTRLLAAKTVVLAVFCAAVCLVLAVVCAAAAATLVAVPAGTSGLAAQAWRPLAVQTVAAVLVAVLGLALGVLLRSTAGGLGAGLALVLVLPPVLALAGGRLGGRLSQGLPALRVGEGTFLAAPTGWVTGLVVAGVWVAVAWTAATLVLERRDV